MSDNVEPSLSFRHAMLKVIWAEQQINNLNTQITWFANNTPKFALKPNPDPHTGYGLHFPINEIPVQFGLMAADIIFNLRSSLDCAWMGLVRANGGSHKKSLPIADNRKGVESVVNKAPIGGVKDRAVSLLLDRLHAHRDHEAGGSQTLRDLNEISNWNKHNMISLGFGKLSMSDVIIRLGDGSVVGFDNVDLIGSAPFLGYAHLDSDKLDYEGKLSFDIIFKGIPDVSERSVITSLTEFTQYCVQALNAFCETFPSDLNPTFAELTTPPSH